MTLQPHVLANDRPRRRTILLVEDEPFVREATCSILESARFEVLPAEDAQEANHPVETPLAAACQRYPFSVSALCPLWLRSLRIHNHRGHRGNTEEHGELSLCPQLASRRL